MMLWLDDLSSAQVGLGGLESYKPGFNQQLQGQCRPLLLQQGLQFKFSCVEQKQVFSSFNYSIVEIE